jgi:hypothetical protein
VVTNRISIWCMNHLNLSNNNALSQYTVQVCGNWTVFCCYVICRGLHVILDTRYSDTTSSLTIAQNKKVWRCCGRAGIEIAVFEEDKCGYRLGKCTAGLTVDWCSERCGTTDRGWARRICVKVKEMKSIIEAYSQRSIFTSYCSRNVQSPRSSN